MSEYIALAIIIGWLTVTAGVGALMSYRYRKAGAEAWFVAGRKYGILVLWLSLGANIYSAYTFLGLPGYTVKYGAKVLAILLYGQLSYIFAFLITPKLWEVAKERGYVTISDFFEDRYGSKALGALTAIIGAIFSAVYIVLQIKGIGIILDAAAYGMLDPLTAKVIAFALVAAFTVVGGMVSVAMINALQGAMMLVAIWGIGALVPIMHYGSWGGAFQALAATKPELLTLSEEGALLSATILLASSLGFWMWPNRIHGVFVAKDSRTVRKNAVALSIFQISQIPIIMAGVTAAAMFYSGKLTLPNTDYALMNVVKATFPPWVVGILGAGAVAAAISTAAALLHSSGSLVARNAFQRVFRPESSEKALVAVARAVTAVIAVIALYIALTSPEIIVSLLLTGYAGVTQFFPGVVLGLWWKKANKKAVLAGLIVGTLVAAATRINAVIPNPLPIGPSQIVLTKDFMGIYGGFWGLMFNFPIAVVGSLIASGEKKRKRRKR